MVAGAAAPGLVVVASARGQSTYRHGGLRGPMARLKPASTCSVVVGGLSCGMQVVEASPGEIFFFGPATVVPMGVAIFPESVIVEVWSPLSPWPWLWRETSDHQYWEMEVSQRLSPPWGHRLEADYN